MGGLNIPAIIDYGAVRLDGSKTITGALSSNSTLALKGAAHTYDGLNIGSGNGDILGLYQYGPLGGSNAFVKWSDGNLFLETDEGTNTTTGVRIRGKGTGIGDLRIYNGTKYIQLFNSNGVSRIRCGGDDPVSLEIQDSAVVPVSMFATASEGQTQTFELNGFRASDQLRTLSQSVGKYFADTAEFYGLTNYLFDGELQSTTLKVSGNIGDGTYTNTVEQLSTASVNLVIDGGGSAITTGIKGYIEMPFACKAVAWTLQADQSGAIKIDIWKDTYANYPPTDADSITNGNEPEIVASGVKAQDLDITDWTGEDSIAAGDILVFNVDSVATITRCTLSLKIIKDNA